MSVALRFFGCGLVVLVLAPLVLAAVLGDKAEDAFRQSMLFSDGHLGIFWSNPLVGSLTTAALLMLLFEALSAATGIAAATAAGRRWLIPWVPLMPFYYPLGALAAYKAHPLYEESIRRVRPLRDQRIAADFTAS